MMRRHDLEQTRKKGPFMITMERWRLPFTAALTRSLAAGLAVLLLGVSSAAAEVTTQEIRYRVGDEDFIGYLAYDDAVEGKRPGVLVVHEWWGLGDYARKRAEMLAAEGYTAFALDMYGSGKTADHPEDARAFTEEVFADPKEAEQRFDAAKEVVEQHETVDADRIAAIGYCFGGSVVLHMARTGADLDGVVSFHGPLAPKTEAKPAEVKAEVLVFTGEADPFVPAEQVQAFVAEMQDANVKYQVVGYPEVRHSFTNPDADAAGQRFNLPLAYDREADENSWKQTMAFFDRLFGNAPR
jgi:dienelactone hydrolase